MVNNTTIEQTCAYNNNINYGRTDAEIHKDAEGNLININKKIPSAELSPSKKIQIKRI